MIDRRKIIVMSKLAVYDKKTGRSDKKIDRLFRRDYIYRQNMVTRFYATAVVLIGLGCYWAYRFFSTDMDLLSLDYEAILTQSVMILVVVLLVFTVIGTITATARYQSAQARLTRYYKLLNHLDRISKTTVNASKGEPSDGTTAANARDDY